MKSIDMSEEMRAAVEAGRPSEAPTGDLEEQAVDIDVENLVQIHIDIFKEVSALLSGHPDQIAAILTASIMVDVRAAVRALETQPQVAISNTVECCKE